jgi:NDP-4-keto-2,6-dideoxyhexose 3-C-methyltransferase
MKCKNCKSKKLEKILRLGSQPISSVFHKKKKNNLKKYSLDLFKCRSCDLIQLSKLAPLDDMYGSTYGYRTSLSNYMIYHIKKKYLTLNKASFLKKNSSILDIGSNDGTFLNFFANDKNRNLKLYGMDPSSFKFKKYYNKKINLISEYFSKKKLDRYCEELGWEGKFDLITSFAMFYDIEDPNSFSKDVYNCLKKNGIWVLEFSYFPLLLKNLTYDQICHEHVTYYTLSTFQKIAQKNGFKILDISFNEINGGSIEVVCAKKNSFHKPKLIKIKKVLDEEKKINEESYLNLGHRIDNTKKILKILLKEISKKDIIGYGASTKGNIVLNHCGLNEKDLSYICDSNPYKFRRYTPGSNIKIISKQQMRRKKPKYLLVLIWSFRSEVIKQEINFIKKGGKLIFHLPMLHIIDNNNYKEFLKKDFSSFSYNF